MLGVHHLALQEYPQNPIVTGTADPFAIVASTIAELEKIEFLQKIKSFMA